MPKTKISEFSSTPASNTDIDSINISEGCAPSGINDAIRELMSQLKDFQVGSAGDPVTVGGVLTVTAGAVGTPAITTAGDTNTGIFFPAADTIAFAEGGAEAMRIDSSGNLGVGVTPSAWGGGKNIQLAASSSVVGSNDEVYLAANSYYNGTNNKYIANGFATQYSQEAGVHKWFIAPTGTAGNNITFTRGMTLDASGNFMVGATSSTRKLLITSGSNGILANFSSTRNTVGDYCIYAQLGGSNTNGTGSYYLMCDTDSVGQRMIVYGNGNIVNVNNSYGTLSDIKLKENIIDATPKLDNIMRLRVRNFNLKSDPNQKQIGFVAQELEQVFPTMVDTSPDQDKEGNSLGTTTKSIKTSVLVPILVKAIQEQQALITQLQADVAALKA